MDVCIVRGLLDSPSIVQYADRIADGLRAYRPHIHVSEFRPPSPSGLPLGRIGRGAAAQVIRHGWYPKHVKRVDADVAHITDHVHAYLLRRLPARRTVVTCHDLTTFVYPENITETSLFPALTRSVFKRSLNALHHAACVVAVSENTKRDILAYSRCTPDQVRVIYHGIDHDFTDSADSLRVSDFRRRHAREGARLLLHVGLNTPYKNVETVLRVVHMLNTQTGAQVRLVKVGQDFTPAQAKLIHDLQLAEKVVHLGRLDRAELVAAYQSCDALLFPSIYEGFGWPPLEAMACGLPVVASTAPALSEILGDAAILREARDVGGLAASIHSLFSNENTRRDFISKGLKRARSFSWQRSISQLVQVYEEVAKLAPAHL